MIAFYLLRGHTLKELTGLSVMDKLFYISAMDMHEEELEDIRRAVER